jgi:hypothetical protein
VLTRGFWFADLESGDGFGGRAAGRGQQRVAVVDAEGMVGAFWVTNTNGGLTGASG